MIRLTKLKVLLLAVVWVLMIISCKKQNNTTLTTFDDPIPFDLLGQGKLVFERIDQLGYSGFYVIDNKQHRCWKFDCGLAHSPSVSPDGELIAYTKWGTDETLYDVYLIDINGKNSRDITNLAGQDYTPSWTYDGTQILFSLHWFSTNTNNIEALYQQSAVPNPTDRIKIIDYSTIDPPDFLIGQGLVSSSPNRKLAVLQAGLRTFDADGSNMSQILPYDYRICSPAWSPDGSKIAFLTYKRNSNIAVVLVNPDGTDPDTLVSLTATGTVDWLGEGNQISLCWSPDGSKIAFTRPDGQFVGSHIYIIGKDHTGLTQVTFAEGVTDFSLSWSH